MPVKIQFVQGDVTEMAVDAIVHPVNTTLALETSLSAAIRRKAGERLQEDCERQSPIRLGAAAATTGGNLPAHFVIHAAVMRPDEQATRESIRLATRASLMRAEEKGLRSMAFAPLAANVLPSEAASIMLRTALDHIKVRTSLERIYFVLPDAKALKAFEEAYQQLTAHPSVPAL